MSLIVWLVEESKFKSVAISVSFKQSTVETCYNYNFVYVEAVLKLQGARPCKFYSRSLYTQRKIGLKEPGLDPPVVVVFRLTDNCMSTYH